MAFKMAPRSPLMKSLKGGQKNLPEGLKKAIEAAPGKMMDSPAKMGRGEKYDVKMASDQNLTAGARKNYAENAEAAQKSSPAKLAAKNKDTAAKGAAAKAARRIANGDKTPMPPTGDSPAKNMNKGYGSPAKRAGTIASKPKTEEAAPAPQSLKAMVTARKSMTKGSSEYNTLQNKINASLGNKKVHGRGTSTAVPTLKDKSSTSITPSKGTPKIESTLTGKKKAPKVLISTKPRNPVGELNLADAPKTKKLVQDPKKAKSVKINQTAAGTTMTTRTGGGANNGGTTEKRKVNKNRDKTVTKTANTRTVTTRKKGEAEATTKTTKRIGKGRIKGAIKEARLARLDRVGKRQAAKVTKRKSTSTQNKMDGLGK